MAESKTKSAPTPGKPLKRRVAALVLAAVAVVALTARYTVFEAGLYGPLLLGVGFLVWSLVTRERGLLVAGGVLIGLGAGVVLQRLTALGPAWDQALFYLCFAGGWMLVWVLEKNVWRKPMHWTLAPAVILALVAFSHLWGGGSDGLWRLGDRGWPFLLLGVAAWLWWGRGKARK
jgi:hypothetical protein